MQKEISKLVLSFNNRFVKTSFGYADKNNGESFTEKQKNEMLSSEIDTLIASMGNDAKEYAKDLENNYNTNTRIINKKSKKPKIEKTEFNVVFRNRIWEVLNMKLSANTKLVYYVLRDLSSYPDNTVLINNQVPTYEELGIIIGVSSKSVGKALKELEENELIVKKMCGHKKTIFINPVYYSTSTQISKISPETLESFSIKNIDSSETP